MWRLKEDLHTVDVGDVVELKPKCGDILFFAHFCVHAASKNVNTTPRLALRSRW
jgi:ectoine hydroxylase-related dioxygenase (phytanoyl-CoA dioxygenase family)